MPDYAWVRTWPKNPPPDRSYIVDDIERVVIDNYDSRPIVDLPYQGVFLLEWDMVISPEEATWFERKCLETPDLVRCAPYRCYDLWHSWWIPWHGSSDRDCVAIEYGDPECDGFGFGATYLPMKWLRKWRDERGHLEKLTDLNFSAWYIAQGIGKVPVHWEVRPVHTHWSWRARPYREIDGGVSVVQTLPGDLAPESNGKSIAYLVKESVNDD